MLYTRLLSGPPTDGRTDRRARRCNKKLPPQGAPPWAPAQAAALPSPGAAVLWRGRRSWAALSMGTRGWPGTQSPPGTQGPPQAPRVLQALGALRGPQSPLGTQSPPGTHGSPGTQGFKGHPKPSGHPGTYEHPKPSGHPGP